MPDSAPAACWHHARRATIERLIRLNTLSPIMLTKYVSRSMMTERGGRIINIASIVGLDRLQRPVRLQRDQGLARRLHPLPGARARPARHHRQCDRARFHRYRDDPRVSRGAARADRAPQRPEAHGGRARTSPAASSFCWATGARTSPASCSRWMPAIPPRAGRPAGPHSRMPPRMIARGARRIERHVAPAGARSSKYKASSTSRGIDTRTATSSCFLRLEGCRRSRSPARSAETPAGHSRAGRVRRLR